MVKIYIPQRHYVSKKVTDLQPMAWRLPSELLADVKRVSIKLGWKQYTTVIAIVVDQFLYQIQDLKELPSPSFKYAGKNLKLLSSRLDPSLIAALNKWADSRSVTSTDIVHTALATFVRQNT